MSDLELFEEDFLYPPSGNPSEEEDNEDNSDDGSTIHYQMVSISNII
jgi:hypothetical protein